MKPRACVVAGVRLLRPERPIRVMLLISSLDYGGAERQVVAIAERLDRRRFEPRVCTLAPHVPLADGLAPDVPLHVVAKRGRFDATVVPRLARLARQCHVDVLHAFLFDAEIAARLAGRLAGTPVVLGSERNSNYRFPWMHRLALSLTRRWSDGLVANSEAGKQFSVRVRGVPESRVNVVYNGVDTDRFSPRSVNGIRQQLGLGPADRVVGMVATFKRQKNHAMFFRVAARVVAEHPNTWFVCVGEPLRDGQQEADAYHREMVELIRALGVRERCLLLGARRDVPDLYNLFDVALLTSEREGTPNALLEAMASGVPVVVTDVADNAIHVADGVTGFVVPLGDVAAMTTRVNALLGDCTRRRAMGRAGRAHVCERYSLATMADRMGAVYELALGRTRPSPVREQGS